MKCTLIVTSGKERSQRSCEMDERLTTREQVVAFLKSQDLRLEAGNFDFTVSLDSLEEAWPLKTDADVRLFLAQARQLGAKATFHIALGCHGAAPLEMESLLSAEYAVDLDLVTLHIYAPSASEASPQAPSTEAVSPSQNRPYQEKTFVVPTRFVLDGLLRAVKDTWSSDTAKRAAKATLYALNSPEDREGVALLDDAAALGFLHGQAKLREPARLTYVLQAAPSPSSRRASLPPTPSRSQQQQQADMERQESREKDGKSPATNKAAVSPTPPPTPDSVTSPAKPKTPNSVLPPLRRAEALTPSSVSPHKTSAAASPSAAASAPSATRRSSAQTPSPTSPDNTTYRAFRCEPASPTTAAEATVEVHMDETQISHVFNFSYLRTEHELWQRFSAECAALFATTSATTAPSAAPMLTLSSDSSVLIDSDGVLRELLALAREAQQPLRVRLHFPSPPKTPPSRHSSNRDGAPMRSMTALSTLKPSRDKEVVTTSALPDHGRAEEASVNASSPRRLPELRLRSPSARVAEVTPTVAASVAEKETASAGARVAAAEVTPGEEASTQQIEPSPPSSSPLAAAPPAQRKVPHKRVQYVYKYNFDAPHRPRSSAN